MAERLQKVLARSGITSRRKAEKLILEGKVSVNNKIVTTLGTKVEYNDCIKVNNKPINIPSKFNYIMLNKPSNYLVTKNDPQGRLTIMSLLPDKYKKLHPIGRLDFKSSGLLLLTDDGEFTNKILHPKYNISKTYIVKVKGKISKSDFYKLCNGIELSEGITLPTKIKLYSYKDNITEFKITVYEGRNNLIRRMCLSINHPVIYLHRIEIGGIKIGKLEIGKYRELNKKELELIKHI